MAMEQTEIEQLVAIILGYPCLKICPIVTLLNISPLHLSCGGISPQ